EGPLEVSQIALAPGIDALGVLADDDEVDALGIREGRVHARVELRGTHAAPRFHLPPEPADHRRCPGSRRAEEHSVGFAARAAPPGPSTCGGVRIFTGMPAADITSRAASTTSTPMPSPGSATMVFIGRPPRRVSCAVRG